MPACGVYPVCAVNAADRKRVNCSLPPGVRSQLRSLEGVDNWRNLLYLLGDWSTIVVVAGVASLNGSLLAYLIAVMVIGARQRALMVLLHEASHNKLLRGRRLNGVIGRLFLSFPLGISLSGYVCAHCRHHGYLGTSKDPETGWFSLPRYRGSRRSQLLFFTRRMALPLLRSHVRSTVSSLLRSRGEMHFETLSYLAFIACSLTAAMIAGFGHYLLLYWLVPYAASFQAIRYLSEMAEHVGLRSTSPWQATRNWETNRLVLWFLAPHNDSLHLTHHLFPLVPHFRIRQAHRLLSSTDAYARAHRCDGFFRARTTHLPSVIEDMVNSNCEQSAGDIVTPIVDR